MAEGFDFSELRNYLQGQMDLGDAEVFFDEPWVLEKRKPAAAPVAPRAATPVASRPAAPAAAPVTPRATAAPAANLRPAAPANPAIVSPDMPAPRPVQRGASPFESAATLEEFYAQIKQEKIYSAASALYTYEGPEHPAVLLLFQEPHADFPAGRFFESPVADMLKRLFGSLNVAPESIGVTYFYKLPESRNFPPLLAAALRKMLAKELSLLAPGTMVTFGEPLFYQLFGKGTPFGVSAGTDMEFAGVKTCSLVDAFAMMGDKQLKLLTWKTHLPKCTYFKR